MPRTDRASRVISASPERVWAALVDPKSLMAWLPPAGMTGRFERFDARPGGSYRMVLTYSDASGAPGKASVIPTSSKLVSSTSSPASGSGRPWTSSPMTLPMLAP
jgi:uncharacterized protein YndB with AHSA1/START domain